ncbi:putative nucleotidyltransferase [Lactobacillus colini]|uniref:tRNA(Met) cytidine acetate ligase n=1 Tax=Lactobacillus colini TaxID=1819254 RepID=A0ABS4MB02_9LACO|nr:nucleotidyltransferase [Lactobacillus colini]MBP2056849.1 putative nucleotidyltransferase [Lactobacillus colini]
MSVVGIVAEYNPFHSGHEFLLNQARLAAGNDPIIVMMSGNYVQRGQMAIMDKWSRAKAALSSGADLVFELPFSFAVQPADIFAGGSIRLLHDLGVSDLVFGVEDANLNFAYLAQKIAQIPQGSFDFKDYTQTYATQYNQMVAREVGHEVNQPNMMLAIAYAVASQSLDNPLTLHPVNRIGSGHDDLLMRENIVSSATSIRNYILHHQNGSLIELKNIVPKQELLQLQEQGVYPNWNLLYKFLKYRLESSSIEELQKIYQMSEGLEYKMKEEIHEAFDFTDFLRRIKSKRYTYARLRRLCLYTLLNIQSDELFASFDDISTMLLGYSTRGRSYLKKMRKDFGVPVISKVDKRSANSGTLALQVKTDRLFEQVIGTDQNFGRFPIEVKNA